MNSIFRCSGSFTVIVKAYRFHQEIGLKINDNKTMHVRCVITKIKATSLSFPMKAIITLQSVIKHNRVSELDIKIENRENRCFYVRLAGDHLYGKWQFTWLVADPAIIILNY